MAGDTRKRIERTQREAGKWALGQPALNIANEFIEGELGWSSFEAKEAKSKILYFARVKALSEDRWPRKVLQMIEVTNLKTRAFKRMKELSRLYG